MNSSKTLIKPQPITPIDLFTQLDNETAVDNSNTQMDHRERILAVMKDFILNNRGIPRRRKRNFTGGRNRPSR